MLDIVRGGQISIHYMRMYKQIISLMIKAGTVISTITTFVYTLKNVTSYELKIHFYYYFSLFFYNIDDQMHRIKITNSAGDELTFLAIDILNNQSVIATKEKVNAIILNGLFSSLMIITIVAVILFIVFTVRGKALKKEKFLRGAKQVPAKELKKIIQKDNQNQGLFFPYSLARIPYPKNTEYTHTIVTGGSGTGKTTLISELIKQIEAKGDRAIIYDGTGGYISKFYEGGRDTILNPLDNRSPNWSLFNEVRRETDLEQIAHALIPDGSKSSDPFWVNAARTVFTETCIGLMQDKKTTNEEIIKKFLNTTPTELSGYLKKKGLASNIINDDSSKTAGSIVSMLSTYIKSLKYLHDDGKGFSVRNWVENDHASPFLFISSRPDQHEYLKPLVSVWMDIAINALLGLTESSNRKVWIILDELPSLHQLPNLQRGLAESRKFGGAFILGLQLMPQLREIYGRDAAESISGLCRTRVVFASPDEDTAKWCANSLGKAEVDEYREGISYGAHEMRDGVNLNMHRHQKSLVLPSEIMGLNNLELFLRFPGNIPITRTKITYKKYENQSIGFSERELPNFNDKLSNIAPPEEDEKDIKAEIKEESHNSIPHKERSIFDIMDD